MRPHYFADFRKIFETDRAIHPVPVSHKSPGKSSVFPMSMTSQPAITFSKLTMETLEQCVKYVQS